MKYTKFKKKYGKYGVIHSEYIKTYKEGNRLFVKDVRNELVNGVWKVHPIRLDQDNVFIACPICGEIHIHGTAKGSYTGARTIHCSEKKEGMLYEILPIMA